LGIVPDTVLIHVNPCWVDPGSVSAVDGKTSIATIPKNQVGAESLTKGFANTLLDFLIAAENMHWVVWPYTRVIRLSGTCDQQTGVCIRQGAEEGGYIRDRPALLGSPAASEVVPRSSHALILELLSPLLDGVTLHGKWLGIPTIGGLSLVISRYQILVGPLAEVFFVT
jgi:hypothetical protein